MPRNSNETKCGVQMVMSAADLTTDPIDCMTCLVDRPSKRIIEATSMGCSIAAAFGSELRRVMK